MDTPRRVIVSLAVLLTELAGTTLAVDYEHEVKPLLAAKCASCHGALDQESGFMTEHDR